MKTRYAFLLVLLWISAHASGQAFITTWKTDNPGASNSTSVRIQTTGPGFNFNVDWNNDGIIDETGITGDVTHDFGTAGTYTIRISGDFPRMYFGFPNDAKKLLAVEQWGAIEWQTMNSAFQDASNMVVNATDAPDLSDVINMASMFSGATALTGNFSGWNVSTITNMSGMFAGATAFNGNISGWNVGAVTDMSFMFYNAKAFNQNLNSWNTSNVTLMYSMFRGCEAFNQPLNNWNVSNVTNLSSMFEGCSVFNQPLNNWNVGNVTDMSYLFYNAAAFNQNIGNWNVSLVLYLNHTFSFATAFNQNISLWNVGSATIFAYTFEGAISFNQPLNSWNVSAGTNMNFMFSGASAFNQNLNSWNVSNVTNMQSIFLDATAFNGNITSWNVSAVSNMVGMFANATAFNQNIGSWNTSSATQMAQMFSGTSVFNQNIGNWNVSNVYDFAAMFKGNVAFNQNIGGWNLAAAYLMGEMFAGASAFNQNIGSWTVSNVPSFYAMFAGATAFNQDISGWNFASASDLFDMLNDCGMSVTNYDKLLEAWNDGGYTNLSLNADGLAYCTADEAHDELTTTKGWTISGDTRDCTSLPVTLVSFQGKLNQKEQVILSWVTSEETQNKGFGIQRSTDGRSWKAIGYVDGNGTTKYTSEYHFTDLQPVPGKSYYRLEQQDLDGTKTFSRIVPISFEPGQDFVIYPNPARDHIYFSGNQVTGLTVMNVSGRIIGMERLSDNKLDISSLPQGIYFIKMKLEKTEIVRKLVKE